MPKISFESLERKPRIGGKLRFELVPKSGWYKNVRTMLSKEDWDTIRKWVYRRAGYVCDICGGVGDKWPVECHEVWSFNDVTRKQTLRGFVALCPKCHGAKHLGHSRQSLSKTKFKRILSHQRRINKWSKAKQMQEWDRAASEYRRRSEHVYDVDISYARRLLFKIRKGLE